MAAPKVYTKSLIAGVTNNIATTQSLAGAGNVTLNGSTVVSGVAVLDTSRQIKISSSGDDHLINFTVYGYEGVTGSGSPIQETIAGSVGTSAHTTLNFGQVTRVAASGATTGTVIVGTNSTGSTPWCNFNTDITPHNTQISVVVTGTVTYGVEYTMDDLNHAPGTPYQPAPNPPIIPNVFPDGILAPGSNATGTSQVSFPFWGVRTTITSGIGSIAMTVIQSGLSGP